MDDDQFLPAADYARKKRKEDYQKYKEQQKQERVRVKAEKEEQKLAAKTKRQQELKGLIKRASDLDRSTNAKKKETT